MTIRAVAAIGGLMCAIARTAPCDTPAPPRDAKVCSRDRRICLVTLVSEYEMGAQLDRELRAVYPRSGLYRAPTKSRPRAQLLWLPTSSLPLAVVLGDGEHVIFCSIGAAPKPGNRLSGSEPVLEFVRRDAVMRTWTLAEIVPRWRELRSFPSTTAERYQWFSNLQLSQDERSLEVIPCLVGGKPCDLGQSVSNERLGFDARPGARR